MCTKFEPKATGESDMWPTYIFAEFWCKCQNKLKIKVMLRMPISYDISQSGYSWLPYTQSLKTAYYLQTIELFLCLSFGQSTTLWYPFNGFLHAVQLRPAVFSLCSCFLPSGIWVTVIQSETEIQTCDKNL